MPGPDLSETGSDLNLVEGEIRHVSESTSFSSPTGSQTPTRPQETPHQTPQEVLEKSVFFSKKNYKFVANLPGGVWGGLLGVWGGLGTQLGLKSLSIRGQGVFPHRPFSCSGRFEASRGLKSSSLAGLRLEKSGFEVDSGRRGGRSCHRVVKLLETKASE